MKKKILVVDDDRDIRNTVKSILEKNGFDVITAVSGDDCLYKLDGLGKVDLILLDIMMPGTPVKDVIPQIPNQKIVFLSVVRMFEAEKEGLFDFPNVKGHISKPFEVKELVKKVKELVKNG